MFAPTIDSTNVVIAKPANPNGAGFAGVQPALGALAGGVRLGIPEPSNLPSSAHVVQPPVAQHNLHRANPTFPLIRGFI
jgi:hypothetical protein